MCELLFGCVKYQLGYEAAATVGWIDPGRTDICLWGQEYTVVILYGILEPFRIIQQTVF